MKVLKKGRDQKGWAKELVCSGAGNSGGGCGAVLLVEEDDLFHTYRRDYSGDSETFTTFRCAECGVLTDIERPAGVRIREREQATTPPSGKEQP